MPEPIADKSNGELPGSTIVSSPSSEIARLTGELDKLKLLSPFRIAELAIEVQIERLRVREISGARDLALERLSESYLSILQKNEMIEQMQKEIEGKGGSAEHISRSAQLVVEIERLKAHIATLETAHGDLALTLGQLRTLPPSDPPPCYEANIKKTASEDQTDGDAVVKGGRITDDFKYIPPVTNHPTELLNARNSLLLSIPLPENPPDCTLTAIVIPPPFTLQEFLNSLPGEVKAVLPDYKILQSSTTYWCPDREEHGFMYVPMFKCTTNPRIATAHRWLANDVLDRITESTECFFNKDGVWYYAGLYKELLLDELSPKEWEHLAPETTSAIVKETIAGRKNPSPQNTYETTQLYAAGALKVMCVGLQCIGFSQEIYNAVLEHSVRFSEGKWKNFEATNDTLAAAGSHNRQSASTIQTKSGSTTPAALDTPGGFSLGLALQEPLVAKRQSIIPVQAYSSNLPMVTNGNISPYPRPHNGQVQVRVNGLASMGLGLSGSTWSGGPAREGKREGNFGLLTSRNNVTEECDEGNGRECSHK